MYKGREAAALSGLTVRALYHYDAIDLLQPPTRSDAGYRLYSSDEVRTPRRIRRYRGFGFSLDEIGELLAATASDRALTERMANTIAEDPDWSERLWAEQRLQQQKVGNAVGRRAPEALTAAGRRGTPRTRCRTPRRRDADIQRGCAALGRRGQRRPVECAAATRLTVDRSPTASQ